MLLTRIVVCCSVLQCGAVCCSVLQCGAVWCSVLQCGKEPISDKMCYLCGASAHGWLSRISKLTNTEWWLLRISMIPLRRQCTRAFLRSSSSSRRCVTVCKLMFHVPYGAAYALLQTHAQQHFVSRFRTMGDMQMQSSMNLDGYEEREREREKEKYTHTHTHTHTRNTRVHMRENRNI